ncbi:MAG TPA: DUF3108 domain-containing protein, partial [Burkholderiaceae bacterium]|nr:DUF3108 domain-containing protein [Burkholderiaceae bacterium]
RTLAAELASPPTPPPQAAAEPAKADAPRIRRAVSAHEPKAAKATAVADSTPPETLAAPPVQLAMAATPQGEQASAPAETATSSGDEPIPHYRTRMPGSTTLRYQVSRGVLHGSGELQWRPQGNQYELKLESKLGGMTLLTQVSSGGFDADGIAPVRFTDTRIRRATVAANFQRDAGKVTFSNSSQELALVPGVQDRVSWMVQLAAIVAAQPNLRVQGAKVVMQVVGANADASIWAFRCVGTETITTEIGAIDALKFVREPRAGAYDTTAQAWLDPKHHFLPARATLRSGPNDEGYELHLQDVIGTP